MRVNKYSQIAYRSRPPSGDSYASSGSQTPVRHLPTFVFLIAVSLGIVAVDVHYGFGWLNEFLGKVANPLTVAFDRTLRPISSSLRSVTETWDARRENQTLKKRMAELERENLLLRNAAAENERLRELLNLKAVVAPSAIAVPVGRYVDLDGRRLMVLRAGEDQGLEVGQPVLSESNQLLGRIVRTSPTSATVRLINDPVSKVRVTLQRTGAQGTLYSQGGNLYVRLDRGENVRQEDLVVTSHLSTSYPEGLTIGEIDRAASSSESDPMVAVEMGLMKSYAVRAVVPVSEWKSFREVFCLPGSHRTLFEEGVNE